jgi:hypothetical protein
MLTVLRQALALLVPAHHCVEGTIVLVANKQGFGSRTAATSTENGSIHQILANIINVAEYIHKFIWVAATIHFLKFIEVD